MGGLTVLEANIAEDALRDEQADEPDVGLLADHVHARLEELRLSVLKASQLGIVSRSTLTGLRAGGRVPSGATLSKLDDLLSWEPGSARRALHGGEPAAREKASGQGNSESGGLAADFGTVDADRLHYQYPDKSHYQYERLAREIDQRLQELSLTKTRFAEIGGPARSTLATMGQRGYGPTQDTLDRIDRYLYWAPGSALAILQGGFPVRRSRARAPHPSLVNLNSAADSLKQTKARVMRIAQSLAQLDEDVDQALRQVERVMKDLDDPRRRDAVWDEGTGTPDAGAAGQSES